MVKLIVLIGLLLIPKLSFGQPTNFPCTNGLWNPVFSNQAGTPSGNVTAPTFTGSAMSTHGHSVTATGTINTPVFSGVQFDNRSAFTRVIFCRKS